MYEIRFCRSWFVGVNIGNAAPKHTCTHTHAHVRRTSHVCPRRSRTRMHTHVETQRARTRMRTLAAHHTSVHARTHAAQTYNICFKLSVFRCACVPSLGVEQIHVFRTFAIIKERQHMSTCWGFTELKKRGIWEHHNGSRLSRLRCNSIRDKHL